MMENARAAIERLYLGVCTVWVHEKQLNDVTKRTDVVDVELLTNQPCRLSFSGHTPTVEDGHVASLAQSVSLFISPNVIIPAGSKIVVTQNGTTTLYRRSGEPSIYATHQEVALELFKGWA
jgi:hypothetical protein